VNHKDSQHPDKLEVSIRTLHQEDINNIINTFCFPWSSIQETTEKWKRYYSEQQKEIRTIFLLELNGQIIGYASLLHLSEYLEFRNSNVPEINDVWVSEKMRNKGLGKALILHLENVSRAEGSGMVQK